MSEASDEFERMVSRIHELLEGADAVVEWNERIPDPDNLKQGRQIDVLVRKDGLLILIECRLRKRRQGVGWVEELMGRRISLEADAIIGVSSSGFTSGAIKKALKYGVILKDLKELSDEEIRSWSRSIGLSIFYYRYENFKLNLVFDFCDIDKLDILSIQRELQNYDGFRTLFSAQLDIIDSKNLTKKENKKKKVNFRVNFSIENFQLCGCHIKEIQSEGVARLEEIKLKVPLVLAYGEPGYGSIERDVYIQKFNMGETKVVHHDGHISITLDLSKLEVPPYWQFRYVHITSENKNHMDVFSILHPEKIIMNVDKIDLKIIGVAELA